MTGSRYVPTVQRRQNAPRGGPKTDYTMRITPEFRLAADRAARSVGVSLPYLLLLGAERLMAMIRDEQEMGLYPFPGKGALEELELIDRAAAAAGMAPGTWTAHTLLDAASKATAAETDTEESKAA